MATLAIGDIHGNLGALEDLLYKVLPELNSDDELVFLGDYIDRGPNTRGCIETILGLKRSLSATVVCLMGNHEDWMLRSYRDPTSHSWIIGMEAFDTITSYSVDAATQIRRAMEAAGMSLVMGKVELPYHLFFDALPPDHLDFFRNLRLYHRTPDVVCVHGGLDPRKGPVEQQSRKALIWGTDDFVEAYDGDDIIVYGHWRNCVIGDDGLPRPRIGNGKTYGIDTIAHGVLTAIRFPGERIFQSSM